MKEFESKITDPKIETFNTETDLIPVTELYAQVFAGAPWNEYTVCTGCEKFSGLSTNPGDNCGYCGKILDLAYPIERTKNYIAKEAQRDNAVAFTMSINGELIGFVWGYTYSSPDEFVNEKYKTPFMQNGIKNLLTNIGIENNFFYFSEVGIRNYQRGKGFSNSLSKLLFQESKIMNLPVVMRTNWESPMVAVANRFGMTQVMGPKTMIDRISRKILRTRETASDFLDTEIEQRVLFVLK